MPNWKLEIGRMRIVGMVEGVSFLLLMGVAMPLKYFADMPLAVTYVGWVHGILFIAYCLTILMALVGGKISFPESVMAFVASLLPFGPFVIDRRFEKDEARERSGSGGV